MESNAADPAPGMRHLRAAGVDLYDQAVATGTIQYPPDEGGVFPLPTHDCLSLRIDATGGELCAARARRDDRTGFMISSRLGPALYLPSALCAVLYRMLCFGCSEPVSVVLDDHRGFLQFTVKDNDPGPPRQGLSDWRLEAKRVGGTITVDLSAILFSSESPVPYRSGSVPQAWSGDKQAASRLTATFEVDLITARSASVPTKRAWVQRCAGCRSSGRTCRRRQARISPRPYSEPLGTSMRPATRALGWVSALAAPVGAN